MQEPTTTTSGARSVIPEEPNTPLSFFILKLGLIVLCCVKHTKLQALSKAQRGAFKGKRCKVLSKVPPKQKALHFPYLSH